MTRLRQHFTKDRDTADKAELYATANGLARSIKQTLLSKFMYTACYDLSKTTSQGRRPSKPSRGVSTDYLTQRRTSD